MNNINKAKIFDKLINISNLETNSNNYKIVVNNKK